MRCIRTLALTAMLGSFGALSAPAQELSTLQRIFTSDSLVARRPQTSPDGRWTTFQVDNPSFGSSLWIMPTAGGAPMRLTRDGYEDGLPKWFASGDRVVFPSTRPNRNGGSKSYLMVQEIDPNTGRAVGAPRQVSSEPVFVPGPSNPQSVSPDGKWIAYMPLERPWRIKLVPANGGTARVVTEVASQRLIGLQFGPDGKHLYYDEVSFSAGAGVHTLKRIPFEGGRAETIATGDHPMMVLPADPRYVLHQVAGPGQGNRHEVRRQDGTLVATFTLPRGISIGSPTGDGWGVMGQANDWSSSIRVTAVATGETRTLTTSGKHWVEAWMADGSGVITDRPDGEGLAVEILPLNGGTRKSYPLPKGTTNSGWNSSVGPYFSARTPVAPARIGGPEILHAIDLRDGRRREVARGVMPFGVSGRGGSEQDGSLWLHSALVESGGTKRIEVRSVDPATGASRLLRSFPGDLALPGNSGIRGFSIHGDQIAYLLQRGDSLDLLRTSGPTGEPQRLASYPRPSPNGETLEGFTWSWKGDRLALSHSKSGGLAQIVVVEVAGAVARVRTYELGKDNSCNQLHWLPDDSSLLMLCYRPEGRIVRLRLSDGELTPVVTGDDPQQIWEYYLSPDGRQVAYPVQRPRGSSIYLADLRALVQGR